MLGLFLGRTNRRPRSFYQILLYSSFFAPLTTTTTHFFARAFSPPLRMLPESTASITTAAAAAAPTTMRNPPAVLAVATRTRTRSQAVQVVRLQASTKEDVEVVVSKETETPRKKRAKRSAAVVTPSPKKKKKTAARTTTQVSTNASAAPNGWQDIYSLVQELRQDRTAPCDHSGAEALAQMDGDDTPATGKEYRFRGLIALMLSSQTKDAVVSRSMLGMHQDGVLSVTSISEMSPERLNQYIRSVGFHNNKTKYIKQTVEILLNEYDGDIPPTAAKMMDLPGVGPKMAFILENLAWDQQTGIGIDTHMHRLFNALGFVKSKTPEQTRVQLEAWLPREHWADANLLWVGFGQEVQQFQEKALRKALNCSRPQEALALLHKCGMNVQKEGKKTGLLEEIEKVRQGE